MIRKSILGFLLVVVALIIADNFFIPKSVNKARLTQDRKIKKIDSIGFRISFDYQLDLMEKSNNNLYFIDWSLGKFFEFSINKKELINTYGNYGESPKEYLNVVYYEINDSIIFSFDNQLKVVKEISFSDSILSYKKTVLPLNSGIRTNQNQFVFTTRDDSNDFKIQFYKSNEQLDEKEEIKVAFDLFQENFSALVYNGYFIKNKNYVVYTTFNTPQYLVFDHDLNFLKYHNLIYNAPKPRYGYDENKSLKTVNKFHELNIHTSLTNQNELLVLSNVKNDIFDIIDVYDVFSGEYKHSFSISKLKNDTPREILMENGVLYVLYHSSLVQYML